MRDDAFSRCHPALNFFYFTVALGFTMFNQHPAFLAISFVAATAYAIWLTGLKKTLKLHFLLTLPGLMAVALLNPLFYHYGVTTLFYIESSGNNVTLEALVYGIVLGCVLFIVIEWFSCYNQVMTSDKFIYLFGRAIPALSLMLSMALRFVPRFAAQLKVIRNGQKCAGRNLSNAGLLNKVRYSLQMLSILVTWALENAIETADSMKGRGYGLPGRTAYSIYRFDKRDRRLLAALFLLSLVFSYGCAKGAAFAQYNPRILLAGFVIQQHMAPVDCPAPLAFATFASFAVFCFLPLLLGVYEEWTMKMCRRHTGIEAALTYRNIYEGLEDGGWA